MKKLYFLILTLCFSVSALAQPVINEIDSDQTGTDTEEFIELKWGASMSLTGYVVVLFNGSDDQSYAAYDLDGFSTDANGFFILATTALAQAGDIDLGTDNAIQNGADAVALYQDDDTTFPNDTPITLTNLIDVVVYDTNDGDDAGLLGGFGESTQYDEDLNGLKDVESLQRTDDGLSYDTKTPTFRAENSSSCGITLGTAVVVCTSNTAGASNDTAEIHIPYTGSDAGITDVTTTSSGTVGGDDPQSVADGTIVISNLNEGDAWDVTIEGGNCDGATDSGTIGTTACDPVFLIINEIHADPDGTNGDANGDGGVDSQQDEFVEIYNSDTNSIDLENYTIEDGFGLRHTFPASSVVPAGGFITVFGGGTPTGINGVVQVASDGALGLNNGGDTVTLKDDMGNVVVQYSYGGEGGNNQSIARDPDFTGPFVEHSTIASNPVLFSPGENNDGTLSVEQFELSGLRMYPNPNTTGLLNISSPNGLAVEVTVYDVMGRQVMARTVANGTLDVSQLNSGLYMLKMVQDRSTLTKKLVIK